MPALSPPEALSEPMALLSLLGTNAAAMQGLRVLLREGRRSGYGSAEVAGVTLTSGPKVPRRGGKPKTRRGEQQAEGGERKAKRKSDARRTKGEEIFRSKRMRKKLLAILPIINEVMGAAASEAAPRAADVVEQVLPQPAEDMVVLPQFADDPMWTPPEQQRLTEQTEVVYGSPKRAQAGQRRRASPRADPSPGSKHQPKRAGVDPGSAQALASPDEAVRTVGMIGPAARGAHGGRGGPSRCPW